MQDASAQAAPSKLLFDGLGHLDQGIAIFDADNRLVVWNRRFLELRGLSEEMVHVGVEVGTLLRHFADRGELGPR